MKKKEQKDNLLSFMDRKRIAKKKRKTQFTSKTYGVDKEKKELDTQIYIDDINNQSERIEAENMMLQKKIDNASERNKLANFESAIDFNNTIATNRRSRIKKILREGKRIANRSRNASLISAATTCFGLCQSEGNIESKIFICISTLYGAYLINKQSSGLAEYAENFFEKDKKGYALSFTKMLAISGYMTFSIITNVMFWNKYYTGYSLLTFSVLFDLVSLINAFESYQKLNLLFNRKTRKEINECFEKEKNKKENQENKNNYGGNVANLWEITKPDGQSDSYTSEGNKKGNKKSSLHYIKNIDMFRKEILKLPSGTQINPKVMNMTEARYNFYRWANVLKKEGLIKKICRKYFVA